MFGEDQTEKGLEAPKQMQELPFLGGAFVVWAYVFKF